MLIITKTLFQDINQSDDNLEENWEFAITEVIVNLEDKIGQKKELIQTQLEDLDAFYFPVEAVQEEVISQMAFSTWNNTSIFMSRSFDNDQSMINDHSKEKWVKGHYENSKSDMQLMDGVNLFNAHSYQTKQFCVNSVKQTRNKSQVGDYEKYMTSSRQSMKSDAQPNGEFIKTSNIDFQKLVGNNEWVQDEMNVLLGLEKQNNEGNAKALVPEIYDHESCPSSQHTESDWNDDSEDLKQEDLIIKSVQQTNDEAKYVNIHKSTEKNASQWFIDKIEILETEVGEKNLMIIQKDAEISSLKLHLNNLKRENEEVLKIKNDDIDETYKKFHDKEKQYQRCKEELEKSIMLLDITHKRSKGFEQSNNKWMDKLEQSELTRCRYLKSSSQFFFKIISVYKKHVTNEQKIDNGSEISNKYCKMLAVKSLKRNVILQSIQKSADRKHNFSLKIRALDCLKYNNMMNKYSTQRWCTSEAFYDFSLKRKYFKSLLRFKNMYQLPKSVENQQLVKISELYRQKVMVKCLNAMYNVWFNQYKPDRIKYEDAVLFYKKKLFSKFISSLRRAGTRISMNDRKAKLIIESKKWSNLETLAFSALLCHKNLSVEHRQRMDQLEQTADRFIVNKFSKLWSIAYQKQRTLNKIEWDVKLAHKKFQTKQYFKEFQKLFRSNKLLKRVHFSNWVHKCKEITRYEVHTAKVSSFVNKRLRKTKSSVTIAWKLHWLKMKTQKFNREQENLRRCLKSDLEEKSKLKKRIQELTLEAKEKQLQISEFESNDVIKDETAKVEENKYNQDQLQIYTLLQENKKLANIIEKMKQPQGKWI